ncbi:MAG TPA: nitrate- and nitrite sensing domain-containing protein, partial [Pseudonocardiaceae bacterium]|nr:nitrate- and nitrite sensing domain-containing protein [Pseudonocardiaceae bacterium]
MTGQGEDLSRWHWRNWPVLVKLIAVLLVPTVVALVVGVLRIVDQAGAAPSYDRISQIAGAQQKLSDLIGALQRERDLATAFVATGRAGDRVPLQQQFSAVDTRAALARQAADQVEDLGPTGYAAALEDLRALRPLRQSVLTGSGPVEVVVSEYGAAVDPLIELDSALVRQLDDVAVADDAAASHALLLGREQVNRQHAIVLAALYADRISPPQIDDVRAAAVRLATVQDEFAAALDPAERAGQVTRAFGDAEESRQRLMQLVLNRGLEGSPLDISPLEWSARTEATTAAITGVENELRQRVDRTALALRDDARGTAAWNTAVLLLLLGLGVAIGIVIARSMLQPLGVLQRTALDVAGRRLPDAMARVRDGDVPDQSVEPVAVRTREEIGQVARAFDEVHSQAIRLAGEQARLRAHVNDILVNLSRRSQSLVERQLQLIDRLESGEQDPEQLDNLFQLDHLATRMRRNSDNLLVLAGTEAAKRASRPVRLVDVLRAAVSEVEQYQRLVLQQPPSMLVLGRTAGDLVHLLAELLDNATQFSPPDTHVMVSAEFTQDGSVAIEVVDRGVGMTEAEIDEANARLGSTPVVDSSVSRRMGLFVVGRLAIRHGIRVRLRRGDDGIGICASVTMPPRLVRPVAESGDSRPTGGAPARRSAAPVPPAG